MTLALQVLLIVIVALLFLTEMPCLSFIAGIVVGMLTIRILFHRFSRAPPTEVAAPETPTAPSKLMFPANPRRSGTTVARDRVHIGVVPWQPPSAGIHDGSAHISPWAGAIQPRGQESKLTTQDDVLTPDLVVSC